MRRLAGAALIAALAAGPARADTKGTSAAQLLKLGAGARATALGEAYTAAADDASAIYWNPAALTRIDGQSLNLMHAELLGGISYEFLGYGQNLGEGRAWGASLQYLSVPVITETDASSTRGNRYRQTTSTREI